MIYRAAGIGLVLTLVAVPAWPCSLVRPVPAPADLVRNAEVIVVARAEGLSDVPGRAGSLAGAKTQVTFSVLRVLKGELPGGELTFNGVLTDRNDSNDRPVPYDFVRRGGRSGNCFALNYRQGAEYLLMLRRGDSDADAQPKTLTPYWSPLAPTNEQVLGANDDPWVAWVTRQLVIRVMPKSLQQDLRNKDTR